MSITYAPASAPAGVAFNTSVQFPPNNQISAQVSAAPSAHSIACPAMPLQMVLKMCMDSPSGLLARMTNQIGETRNQSNISASPVRTVEYHSTDHYKDRDRHLTMAWSHVQNECCPEVTPHCLCRRATGQTRRSP